MKCSNLESRLNKYIERKNNGCWIWFGANTKGHGVTSHNGKQRLAKHIIFELYNPNLLVTGHLKNTCGDVRCVNPDHYITRETKMWSLIKKIEQTNCWEWQGTIKGGYGFYCFNGKKKLVHRVLYERFKGKIPIGLNVCHSCDNAKCVNPDHLWLGTQYENIKDMEKKNRQVKKRGQDHIRSKITEDQAIEIKKKYKEGIIPTVICKLMNLPYSTVYKICINENWKHIIV